MSNIKFKIWALYAGIKNSMKDWRIAIKGQSIEFEILQIAHRLEKGLLIQCPRELWGWNKAKRLYCLTQITDNKFVRSTGESVLSSYLLKKKNSSNRRDKNAYTEFINQTGFSVKENAFGGINHIIHNKFNESELSIIRKLFNTRHSVRTFSSTEIPMGKLFAAIDLALKCPSACNRQPFKVYIVNAENKKQFISKDSSCNGKYFLYITGDISAYTLDEINDWIVSPSIFVGYLTLSMHAMGIGSCVIRKDLVVDTDYNKAVRAFCKIPKNEKLILELAIGIYEDSFFAPVSNRKTSEETIVDCN